MFRRTAICIAEIDGKRERVIVRRAIRKIDRVYYHEFSPRGVAGFTAKANALSRSRKYA